MVKVQKPTPKTLSKLAMTKNSINKKKVAATAEAPSTGIKKMKSKLIKAILKNEKILPPVKENQVKSEKKGKDKMEYPGASAASVNMIKKNKNAKNEKVPTKKRPAVLASHQPNSSAGKSKKNMAKKAKVTSNATPALLTADIQIKKAKNVAGKSIQSANVPPKQQERLAKMEKKRAAIKAYKKQKNSLDNEKKEATVPKYIYEPVPFDEDKFKAIVCVENIKKMAEALQKLVEQELAQRKTSIFSDYKYCLNIGSFQIASCPKRMVKLNLKHSLVDKDDDVVIIVPDLKRGSKVDYEPTIQHYEDLFREAGIKDLKIIPFNQLKTEYTSFESLRKLSNTYDYFLCDGRLVSHVAGFCGTIFQKPRTTFHGVRMDGPNLKMNIDKSMRRTAFKQLHKGDLISIPVGTHKFTSQQLAENIDHVVAQLKTLYPGGLGNVRAMHLKIALNGTSSLPIYISMAQPPLVTPYVVGKREERMLKMKKEANEVLAKFAMTKDGKLLKLSMDQIKNKMRIKAAKEQLATKLETAAEGGDDFKDLVLPTKKARNVGKAEVDQDSKNINSNEPDAKDDDDEESAVLAKKSRKEEIAEVEKDSIKTNADEQTEPEPDEDEPDDSDSDDDDNIEEYETEGDLEDDDEHEAPQDVQDSDDDDDDEEDDDTEDDDDDDEDQDDDDSD